MWLLCIADNWFVFFKIFSSWIYEIKNEKQLKTKQVDKIKNSARWWGYEYTYKNPIFVSASNQIGLDTRSMTRGSIIEGI